jgi:hypothetical protein
VAAAGSGVGQLALAPLIQMLEERIHLGQTILVLAAAIFSALFFALMYKIPQQVRLVATSEPVFVNLLRSPGIDVATSEPVFFNI